MIIMRTDIGLLLRARLARAPKPPLPIASPVSQDAMFPLAVQLANAPDHPSRASLLLTMSDAVVLSHGDEMGAACEAAGFAVGAEYLTFRVAALCATRDQHGALPEAVARPLAHRRDWLDGLARTGGNP